MQECLSKKAAKNAAGRKVGGISQGMAEANETYDSRCVVTEKAVVVADVAESGPNLSFCLRLAPQI